ncbi:DMT family transporter [Aquabacterium sp.]|uniref:DMT family transporter n=1 Tax=Aquabacterium sp. TaxID=1872578 RepID=UPI002C76D591|nr:DMT family transporter [Aquabacterium sp.]HSW05444.1 DMT family transporter [Aquabacterium sp.]
MPLTALALVLVAALLHASWNIVAKKSNGSRHFVMMGALMIMVLWAPLGLVLAWQQVPAWGWREWALLLASALAHLLYFNVLLAGYRASDLTVVYPVARGTGPLVSSFVAVLLLGETLGARGAAGVLGIAGGVFLIAGGPKLWSAAHDPRQRTRLRAGVAWGAATGLLIATYTVIDGYAVKVMLMSPILVDWVGNVLRIPFMLPAVLADRPGFVRDLKTQWRAALLLAAISPVSYTLVLYAVQMAPLSHVAPAREVSMLFAALIGGRLLGETDRGLRLIGAACIAAGVMALAWA